MLEKILLFVYVYLKLQNSLEIARNKRVLRNWELIMTTFARMQIPLLKKTISIC
jgi:hypothetical protein